MMVYYTNYVTKIIPTTIITKEYVDTNLASSSGGVLEEITEGSNTGYRINGSSNGANYGDIGKYATDLSYSSYANGIHGATGNYSFAVGEGVIASGLRSVAMGIGATASGNMSIAVGGTANTASGDYSRSFGSGNSASGNYSTAMGWNNTVSGGVSRAFGYENTASGNYSTAIGSNNICQILMPLQWEVITMHHIGIHLLPDTKIRLLVNTQQQ